MRTTSDFPFVELKSAPKNRHKARDGLENPLESFFHRSQLDWNRVSVFAVQRHDPFRHEKLIPNRGAPGVDSDVGEKPKVDRVPSDVECRDGYQSVVCDIRGMFHDFNPF